MELSLLEKDNSFIDAKKDDVKYKKFLTCIQKQPYNVYITNLDVLKKSTC